MAALAETLRDVFKAADFGTPGANGASESKGAFKPLPPGDIFLSKLPVTGDALFGREEELETLDEAWKTAPSTCCA